MPSLLNRVSSSQVVLMILRFLECPFSSAYLLFKRPELLDQFTHVSNQVKTVLFFVSEFLLLQPSPDPTLKSFRQGR